MGWVCLIDLNHPCVDSLVFSGVRSAFSCWDRRLGKEAEIGDSCGLAEG